MKKKKIEFKYFPKKRFTEKQTQKICNELGAPVDFCGDFIDDGHSEAVDIHRMIEYATLAKKIIGEENNSLTVQDIYNNLFVVKEKILKKKNLNCYDEGYLEAVISFIRYIESPNAEYK